MILKVDKNFTLMALALSGAIFLLIKTTPQSIKQTVKTTIYQQKESIKSIDSPMDTKNSKTFFVDSADFLNPNSLKHPKLGELGFRSNFFANFESQIDVKSSQEYIFSIYSDDGFKLFIDEKPICEFSLDRPLTKTECPIFLDSKVHKIKILYFQGGGNMGFRGLYRGKNEKKETLIGVDSKNINFMEMK